MPGGTTHGGTVQITIVADVTDFNRGVRNAARAASVGTKVKVGFEVDDNELRTKVQAAVAAAGLGLSTSASPSTSPSWGGSFATSRALSRRTTAPKARLSASGSIPTVAYSRS